MTPPDPALAGWASLRAELEQADLEVSALFVTATTLQLRQALVVVRNALTSWDPAQARLSSIAFLRRVVADVRSNARGAAPRDVTEPPERRLDARVTVTAPVSFTPWDPSQTYPGVATDVSMGGALVSTSRPLSVGCSIAVRLRPPGWAEEAVLAGVVQRASSHCMGVRFLGRGVGPGPEAIRAIMGAGRGEPLWPLPRRDWSLK
jgi:hypothetical protein